MKDLEQEVEHWTEALSALCALTSNYSISNKPGGFLGQMCFRWWLLLPIYRLGTVLSVPQPPPQNRIK